MKFFNELVSDEEDDLVDAVPASGNACGGITFLVAKNGHVFFTSETTDSLSLLERTPCSAEDIAWGGVLTESGDWVRKSARFGDAPDSETRRRVILQILDAVYQEE